MKRARDIRQLIPANVFFTAFLAVVSPGCSGCSDKAPLAFVPQDAVAVAVVPSIKDAAKGIKVLLDHFRDEALIKQSVSKGKGGIVKELGFDPEKPETMKAKGIDPAKGIAASVGSDGKGIAIVIGVSDQKEMEKFIREMANKALSGTATFQEKTVNGIKTTSLSPQGSERVLLAWAHVKDHVIFCPKAKEQKLAEYAVKIATQEKSIEKNKLFSELKEKLGKHQAMLFVDGQSMKKMIKTKNEERMKTASEWMKKVLQEQQETVDNLMAYYAGQAMGIHLSEKGITIKGYFAIPSAKGEIVEKILKGIGSSPDFGEYIGPDALAIGRFSLNVKKLWEKVRDLIPPQVKQRLYRRLDMLEQATKINVEKDIMSLVAGRFAFSFFAPSADLFAQGFDIRSPEKMLAGLPMLGMVQVTNPKKANELLSTLERIMTREGVYVRTKSEGNNKIYYVGSGSSPIVSWTISKDLALVATGDRLTKTLALMDKGGDNVLGQIESSRAKELFKKADGIVVHFNVSKTADLIRSLQLQGGLRLMISSASSTIGKFEDVTWGAEVDDGGILGEINIQLK